MGREIRLRAASYFSRSGFLYSGGTSYMLKSTNGRGDLRTTMSAR